MSQIINLNNTQLASEITVGYNSENGPQQAKPTAAEKKADPNAKGKLYRTLIYNGVGFTVSEAVFQQWQDGKLASMKLIQDTRPVTITKTDKETGAETSVTEDKTSYSYSGSLTKAAALSNKQFDVKMTQLDVLASVEAASMTPEQVQALLAAEL